MAPIPVLDTSAGRWGFSASGSGTGSFVRRLRDDLHPRLQQVLLVGELQPGPAPLEQAGEHLLELGIDVRESLGEPLPRRPVDLLDRPGQVVAGGPAVGRFGLQAAVDHLGEPAVGAVGVDDEGAVAAAAVDHHAMPKAVHVHGDDLGDQHLGDGVAHSGDGAELFDSLSKGTQQLLHPAFELADTAFERIDLAQVQSEHEAMVLVHAPT